jgi:hypothetical protein
MNTLAAQPQYETNIDEQIRRYPPLYLVPDPPETTHDLQPRLAQDVETEAAAQAGFNQWLGSVGTAAIAELEPPKPRVSLLERLRAAKAGSAEALKMIGMNVATATAEASFKGPHIASPIVMRVTANGEFSQHGQTDDDIQHNALTMRPSRHPVLERITQIEALNRHRIKEASEAGLLKDYYFLVPSIVPAGVPEKDLGDQGDGYFLDGLTYSLQATTERNPLEVVTEPAFLQGVEADPQDSFEDRLAKRHDIRALQMVYKKLKLKAPETAEGFLQGVLIPKEMMPNGVADFMRLCEEAADQIHGRINVRTVEDYMALKTESKRRELSLKDVNQKVIGDLLASVDSMTDPMDPVGLMWRSIRNHLTENSFTNMHIDPAVLGKAAAPYVIAARTHIQKGNHDLAHMYMREAYEKAVVTGCGGGGSSEKRDTDAAGNEIDNDSSAESDDECTFVSEECPVCHEKNVETTITKTHIKGKCGCEVKRKKK